MLDSVGGLERYISRYGTNNPERISFLQNLYRMSSFIVFLLIPFIIPIGFWMIEKFGFGKCISSRDSHIAIDADFIQTMLWWLIPPLLFFLIVHYSKGYYLLIAIPIFALMILFVNRSRHRQGLLAGSIVLQILIFTAFPYSLPDVQTYISQQNRHLNIVEVWWERTKSVFLMASSQIRALDGIASEFETVLASLEELPKGEQFEFLFVDPTIPLSARALQAKYPQRKFTVLSYREKDRYQLFTGFSTKSKTGFRTMLGDALIVSQADFVNQYLSDIPKEVYHSGTIVFFSVPSKSIEVLTSRYEHLFSRRQ